MLLVEDGGDDTQYVPGVTRAPRVFSTVARTPKGAIRLTEEHAGKIDLMLTDMAMPEMNGLELADRLQSIQPTLKCLYMSGYSADTITYQAFLQEGMNFLQSLSL